MHVFSSATQSYRVHRAGGYAGSSGFRMGAAAAMAVEGVGEEEVVVVVVAAAVVVAAEVDR